MTSFPLLLIQKVADTNEPDSNTDQIEERGKEGEEGGGVVGKVDKAGGEEGVGKQIESGDENYPESLAETVFVVLNDASSSEHNHHDES